MKRIYFAVGQGFTADGSVIRHHELLEWRQAAYQRIADTFGGATSINVMGAWIGSNGHLVRERSWGIEVFTDGHTAERSTAVAEWLKAEFRQESVMVAVSPVETLTFV
jgi:hypothetical protein